MLNATNCPNQFHEHGILSRIAGNWIVTEMRLSFPICYHKKPAWPLFLTKSLDSVWSRNRTLRLKNLASFSITVPAPHCGIYPTLLTARPLGLS